MAKTNSPSQTPSSLGGGSDGGASDGGDKALPEQGPALDVIAAFGGIRGMANKMGIAVSTVQGWRERAAIPLARHEEVLQAAKAHGVDLSDALLASSVLANAREGAPSQSGAAPSAPKPSVPVVTPVAKDPTENTEKKNRPGPAGKTETKQTARVDSTAPLIPPTESLASAPETGSSGKKSTGGYIIPFLLGALAAGGGFVLAILLGLWGAPQTGGLDLTGDQTGDLRDRLAAVEETLATLPQAGAGVDLSDLEGQVSDLESALAALHSQVAALPAPGPALDLTPVQDELGALSRRIEAESAARQALGAELSNLTNEIDSLRQSAALSAGQGDQLAGLQDDLRALQQQLLASSPHGVGLALAAVELRNGVRSGEPFYAEMAWLDQLAEDDTQLATIIAPLHDLSSGVATMQALSRTFQTAAREAISADLGEGADGQQGWWSDVQQRLSELVTVRPVGEVAGDDAPAILARAELRLGEGHLLEVMAELENLGAAAGQAMVPWRDQALARLTADQASDDLMGYVVSQVLSNPGEGN